MQKYSAIREVEKLLSEKKIPYELRKHLDGYILAYPDLERCKFDIVQHEYSYGSEANLLEAMGYGIPDNDVEGWLTVENAVEYFVRADKHFKYGWKQKQKNKFKHLVLSKKPLFWIWFSLGAMNLLFAEKISKLSYFLVWAELMIEYLVWILIMREKK